MVSSGASAGSIGAAGFSIAARAISIASARLNCGVCRRCEAPDVQVVDDLLAQVGDVLDERGVATRRRRARRGRRAPPGRSRGWSRWSRSRSRRARRRGARGAARPPRACRTRGDARRASSGSRRRPSRPASAVDEPFADALAQLARGHARERDQQELIQRHAVGDVARGERGDGERLAGARTRLEHGHAGRQRPADVERGSVIGTPPAPRRARRPTAGARRGRSRRARGSSSKRQDGRRTRAGARAPGPRA